jgi:DNA-binding NarL/FixJ family response regulator
MAQQKVFVLTNQKAEIGLSRHSSLTSFRALMDACGFDLSVKPIFPCLEELYFYQLIFIDATQASTPIFFKQPIFTSHHKSRIILFGVSSEQQNIEYTALRKGLRGVFYENDTLDNMIKGIQKVKNGKYWFKRDTMESVLRQLIGDFSGQEAIQKIQDTGTELLTKREKMITSLICQGAQNKEIAEQLYISVNTVKTHIYTIFRKTNCRNRVELINCVP